MLDCTRRACALDTFNPDRIARLHELDKLSKDPGQFAYVSDVLAKRAPGLRSWPNLVIKDVIDRKLFPSDLPDGKSDADKALSASVQSEFVAQHEEGVPILCEALGASACMGTGCPFLVPPNVSGVDRYVCSQGKFTFAGPGTPPPEDVRLVV
jgi:hypothetical protein